MKQTEMDESSKKMKDILNDVMQQLNLFTNNHVYKHDIINKKDQLIYNDFKREMNNNLRKAFEFSQHKKEFHFDENFLLNVG